MSLQFILGSSGSGKSHYIYNRILEESYKDFKSNTLVIVPEQFTMQTQRMLVSLHKNHSIQNIDILSFERLCHRVIDELGIHTNAALEETGKSLLLRKVAEENKNKLSVLGGNITRIGYVTEMKSLISEFMQYGIEPSDLDKCMDEAAESFRLKLEDVKIIYQEFLDELEDKYVTSDKLLTMIISVAEKSKMFRNATLVLDGYTGFTPIQREFLEEIIPLAKDVYVTATIDPDALDIYDKDTHELLIRDKKAIKEHDLFAMSKRMLIELYNIAANNKVEWIEPHICDGLKGRLKANAEIAYLEKSLFRPGVKPYTNEVNNIEIASLKDPRAELQYVAEKICRLVREEDYRFKDFAIVCADLETYSVYIKDIFDKYSIPVFMDDKKEMLKVPFIEHFRSLLDMIQKGYTYESVFRFLRSGFSCLSDEETDILENYIRATGIRGYKKWNERFIYIPRQFEEDMEQINASRENLISHVSKIQESILKKGASVEERCDAIMAYFERENMQEILEQRADYFESRGDMKNASEYRQIYSFVTSILDKMKNFIGSSRMPMSEFIEILDAGFESKAMATIPNGYDRVVVGDIERTRLDAVKILFFTGINDGNIPKAVSSGGIISSKEREEMEQKNIELAPGEREQTFRQKFYLYMLMTKPSEKLFMSYSRVGVDSSALRKSYLISTITKLMPQVSVNVINDETYTLGYMNRSELMDDLAIKLVNNEGEESDNYIRSAIQWVKQNNDEEFERLLKLLEVAMDRYEAMPLSEKVVKSVYGKMIEGSVTRLEKYAACAYSHFLRYGLRLNDRMESSFGGLDMGSILHAALENYSHILEENGCSWRSVPDDKSEEFRKYALKKALDENHNLSLYENARNEYSINRMDRYLSRSVDMIRKQVKTGLFEPTEFEKKFRIKIGEDMGFDGTIDRIDVAEIDDDIYVNVIDYKSGSKTLEYDSIYYGQQIQLSMYMANAIAICKEKFPGKSIRPGGMFYFHIADPIHEGKIDIDPNELETARFKSFKMDGVVVDNLDVYGGIDFGLRDNGYRSPVISVAKNKDGSLDAKSAVIEEESLENILIYVEEKTRKISEEIKNGNIAVSPSKKDGRTACDYCSFTAVCGFDKRLDGYKFRELNKMKKDDVLAAIAAELEE